MPAGAGPDTQNILPALLGESKTGREELVEHSGTLALRKGNWKFIPANKGQALLKETKTETANAPQPQLYDLASDPGERNNVATNHLELVKELAATLQRIRGNNDGL